MNELTDFSRVATIDADGSYLLPLLPVSAEYQITVVGSGFKSALRSHITLQVEQNLRVDFQLPIGNISEKVEVTAAASMVESRSSAGGDVLERESSDCRTAAERAQCAAIGHAAARRFGHCHRTTIDGGNRSGNQLDVSGARSNEIDWQLDGVHFAGSYSNTGMNMPSPDARQEFRRNRNQVQ